MGKEYGQNSKRRQAGTGWEMLGGQSMPGKVAWGAEKGVHLPTFPHYSPGSGPAQW